MLWLSWTGPVEMRLAPNVPVLCCAIWSSIPLMLMGFCIYFMQNWLTIWRDRRGKQNMATEIAIPLKLEAAMTEKSGLITGFHSRKGDTVAAGSALSWNQFWKIDQRCRSTKRRSDFKIISQAGDTVPFKKVIAWIGEAGESSRSWNRRSPS